MWLEDDLTQTPIKTKHDFVDIYLCISLSIYVYRPVYIKDIYKVRF